ncbi:MAG TPA: prepilin-type N-terminal cleavage/methylation domain-containing protein [Tepidisphaeraceae bacterium]|nr:prepilin-type N-terminal cleavage/methylation domain-containing protein [Tepidisphaeraceae bacterium]
MPRRRRAFSLVEILVVIAIIAILLAIVLPVVNRVRELSRRTACARNLQNAGAALHAYANAHHGKLPQHPLAFSGESFAYMVPAPTAAALLSGSNRRATLYCPSGDLQEDTAFWRDDDPKNEGLCLTGYHWFVRRTASGPPPLNLPKQYHASLSAASEPGGR